MLTRRRLLFFIGVLLLWGTVVLLGNDVQQANFESIYPGMTLEEVKAILGTSGKEVDMWAPISPSPNWMHCVSAKMNRVWESGWTVSGSRSTLYTFVSHGKVHGAVIHDHFFPFTRRSCQQPWVRGPKFR